MSDRFRFCRTFWGEGDNLLTLTSNWPLRLITTVVLTVARYLSLSQTHVCRESRTLWGERSEASLLPAAFKVTAEKQPKCEFSSSEFQNKEREKGPYWNIFGGRVHDQWIEYRKPWLHSSWCTLDGQPSLSSASLWAMKQGQVQHARLTGPTPSGLEAIVNCTLVLQIQIMGGKNFQPRKTFTKSLFNVTFGSAQYNSTPQRISPFGLSPYRDRTAYYNFLKVSHL